MKLSIIIPTFNSASVLGRALDSIICQTFTDWEVLIMDGASNDDTVSIAKSYNNDRIRIFSEPDKGIYDAMNKGIKLSQGEWLYFLGSDDWLFDKEVLNKVFGFDNDSVDVMYGEVESPNLNENHKGKWSKSKISFNRCHQGIFYRRRLFNTLGLYDTTYKLYADHAFNIKWFCNKKINNKYLPFIVAYYSVGGSSSEGDDAFDRDFPLILYDNHCRNELSYREKVYCLQRKKIINQKWLKNLFYKMKIKYFKFRIFMNKIIQS